MADYGYTQPVYNQGYYGQQQVFHQAEPEPAPQVDPQPQLPPSGLDKSKLIGMVGAVASLALVVGVGVWSYKLVARDVSGVPVVRAAQGPMRVQPQDPGGQPADHQGLAVNAVAAQGTAAPTADRLVLAPRPVALTVEDQPAQEIQPTPAALTVEDAQHTALSPDPAEPVTGDAVEAFREGSIDALVDQLTQGVDAMEATAQDPATHSQPETLTGESLTDEAAAVVQAVTPIYDGPGLRRSLRPVARPATLVASNSAQAVADALASAEEAAKPLDVDPASLPAGTRLAQLGAYDSADVARVEWDKFYARFETYMEGKQRVIQKASSGGRTFYRLRAMGFADLSDARRFCSALVAENADCIPVTTR